MLFAGIGGPDAVRKLLAELPPDLSRPVLVQLRLDGGRYDNLVKQLERVSALPVLLAKAGEAAARCTCLCIAQRCCRERERRRGSFR